MKNFIEKFWNKIKQPKGIKLVVFLALTITIILSTVLLVIFVPKQTVFHFLMYVLAAICLLYFIYMIVYLIPIVKKEFKLIMSKNKYTNKFITSYGFRAFVFAICSFVINVGYATLMGIVAILIKSTWFGVFAVYYLILSIMRGGVIWSKKKHIKHEENSYLAVAISLIILTIAAVFIVVLTHKGEDVSRYEGLLIYCSAVYTFYKLSLSIYNIIKAKKQESLLVEAVKDISFVDALISIFVLQVSMLHIFSKDSSNLFLSLNALTGSLVCLGIITVSFLMILKYIRIKRSKNTNKAKDEIIKEETFIS